MTVLKCKMCGGDLELSADQSIGTCTHCGSKSTRPRVDSEHQTGLFNRGNALRMAGDYDKAAGMFEAMILADPSNAEAHWCLLLCRYGIEYVEDPKTRKRVPTCHRMSNTLITNDPDYELTLEHADGFSVDIYKEDAEKIADVQKAIIAISRNEKPYDIFICYKETPTSGRGRTPESVKGQDIYEDLTNMGYRVFFARRTLENRLGTEYEPYIFAALNSAKIMLVMGSSAENLNSVWVKNEWSRYMALMRVDRRNRNLIPCCVECDPCDLPDELAVYQAVDLDNLGAYQDLLVGIKKVLGERVAATLSPEAASVMAAGAKTTEPAGTPSRRPRVSADTLAEQCYAYICKKDYKNSAIAADRLTTQYPNDHRGWWYKILVVTENLTKIPSDRIEMEAYYDKVHLYADADSLADIEKKYGLLADVLTDYDAIEAADALRENGDYKGAQKYYQYLTEKYPSDYRGWWGLIICDTKNFTAPKTMRGSLPLWYANAKQAIQSANIDEGSTVIRSADFNKYLDEVTAIENEKWDGLTYYENGRTFGKIEGIDDKSSMAIAMTVVWFIFSLGLVVFSAC